MRRERQQGKKGEQWRWKRESKEGKELENRRKREGEKTGGGKIERKEGREGD